MIGLGWLIARLLAPTDLKTVRSEDSTVDQSKPGRHPVKDDCPTIPLPPIPLPPIPLLRTLAEASRRGWLHTLEPDSTVISSSLLRAR